MSSNRVLTESQIAAPGATQIKDAVIRIAGNSQDGIQTVGELLARLSGRSAQEVMTHMTIPATISGGPSIYQVRIGAEEVLSAGDEVDVLVAFYQHSYEEHLYSLRKGGILLYDSDNVNPDLDDKRFTYVGVPITTLTIEAIGGRGRDKGKNMFLLGLIARMFDLDVPKLTAMLKEWGARRDPTLVQAAMNAVHVGYAYEVGRLSQTFKFIPGEHRAGRAQVVMNGNQAIAYGLLAAGVRFGAAYPITPWSSIMEILRSELPKYGGVFVQAEDELAAISMALGASYGGHVAVTGSSGPGLSLKTEALGWGVMAEMPLVIIDVQRGGPSTGLPTKVEQSDLNHAVFGGHGDAPRIVLAASSVEDAFYSAIEAVELAREYSCPVILLTDQAIATRVEAWDEPDLEKIVREVRPDLSPRGADFRPYAYTPTGITHHAPPGAPVADHSFPVVTGLEHDEHGHPGEQPHMHMLGNAKRRRKLQTLASRLPMPALYGPPEGHVLLVGWGSTLGPIHEAVDQGRLEGEIMSAVHIKYLSPLPPGLDRIFEGFNHIIVVEANDAGLYGYGQLAGLLRARYCNPNIHGVNKTDGLSFKVREILEFTRRLVDEKTAMNAANPP
jgi:2-oxoglutarate ferredoxin oxidoreductase subunit alpha